MKSKTLAMVMAITLAFGTYAFAEGRGYMGRHSGMNQGTQGYSQKNTNLPNGQNQGNYGYSQQNTNSMNGQNRGSHGYSQKNTNLPNGQNQGNHGYSQQNTKPTNGQTAAGTMGYQMGGHDDWGVGYGHDGTGWDW